MKLVILIILLTVSGIIIISGFSFFAINDLVESEKQHTMDALQLTSSAFSGLISHDLNERISDVDLLTGIHSPLLSETLSLNEKRDYLLLFLTNYPDYDSISLYDADGIKLLDSNDLGIGSSIINSEIFKQTIQNSNYYDIVPVFENHDYVNLNVPDDPKDFTHDLEPMIRFSSTLYSNDGTIHGIVVANYSLLSLFNSLQKISDSSIQFEILSFDRHSIIHSKNYENLSYHAHLNLIPNTVFIDDNWIVSTSILPSVGRYIENTQLLVLVKTDQSIAFKEIIEQQQYLQTISGITLAVIVLITLMVMRKLGVELSYIQTILQSVITGKKFETKNLLFEETKSFESKIQSTENLLRTSKSSNQQKLALFDEITKIMSFISDGNLSHQLTPSNSDPKNIVKLKLNVNNAIKQLSQVESDRSSFSAMITHELKTPLVPIKGYAEMLKKEKLGPLTVEQKDAVSEILASVESLFILIQSILTAQKESSDGTVGTLTTLSTKKLIDSAYNKMSPSMELKKIHFKKNISIDSLITVDYEKIIEVFVNLIQNSIDFVPAIDGAISIGCTKNDVGVLCFVKDNGIGMTKDQQQKIFKKFYQVDTTATRKHGGTGLGLSICKSIIENHGGTIWATGSPSSGTTIFFTIPSKGTTGANFA